MTLPKTVQSGITARVKILANLKIDEHMMPQDGRFKIQIQDDKLAFRVSILPVYDGEKIVMRLLHEGAKPLDLEQLGILAKPQKIVAEAIKKPRHNFSHRPHRLGQNHHPLFHFRPAKPAWR